MTNQTLATLALAPIILAGVTGILAPEAADGIYAVLGLWIMVFGTWADVRLYKIAESKKE